MKCIQRAGGASAICDANVAAYANLAAELFFSWLRYCRAMFKEVKEAKSHVYYR